MRPHSFGVFIDAAADEWRHYELFYVKQGTSIEGTVPMDLDVDYLQLGGTVMYQDARDGHSFFGMTIGAARLSPNGPGLDDATRFALSLGGGFKVPVTDHIGVRFDARAFLTSSTAAAACSAPRITAWAPVRFVPSPIRSCNARQRSESSSASDATGRERQQIL